MLTSQFLLGLREELRSQVERQLPDSMAKVAILAAIQKSQRKTTKQFSGMQPVVSSKADSKPAFTPTELCKAIDN
jgi:hypothetical protein